jgi:hypothetical protein
MKRWSSTRRTGWPMPNLLTVASITNVPRRQENTGDAIQTGLPRLCNRRVLGDKAETGTA